MELHRAPFFMATLTVFKDMVAGYMNRTAASFVTSASTDLLLQAINDARRSAQRKHVFELNRSEDIFIVASAAGTNWTTGCTSTPGGSTVAVRRLDRVYTYETSSVGGTPVYIRRARIPFFRSRQYKTVLPTLDSREFISPNNPPEAYVEQFAYCMGPKFYLSNQTVATSLKLEGVVWLDDLTDSSDPDIFLTYFTDWLLFATILHLNVYLKDSERYPLDARVASDLFESVKTLDGDLAQQGEELELD